MTLLQWLLTISVALNLLLGALLTNRPPPWHKYERQDEEEED